ncbi:MAG: NAD-dependent epimerase/dehydratase [uncultured bacterium]|nr:MAG: NAD-dependent epimerase/dehydratase [uncultured bacterium]
MKKVLVVGGAGYIGGVTTDLLTEQGFEVTVLDKLLYENRFLKPGNFIYADVRDTSELVRVAKKFDQVIWLAALVGDGACAQNPDLADQINTQSLHRFLEKTKSRVIFTSTCSVYGAQKGLIKETDKTHPLSIYAATKLRAEKAVLKHKGLVFRLGTLFGLGDNYSRIRLDLVINILTLRAIRDKKLTVFGGNQWRPVIAVRDVAGYLAEAVTNDAVGVFNVNYKNMKIVDLAVEVKNQFPKVVLETTEMSFEDLRNYRVDTGKIKKQFRFRPKVSVGEEVARMAKVIREHRIKNVEDNVYYNTHQVRAMLVNHEIK